MVLQLVPTESWVRTSFRHTLFSTLLQETPEPGNPRWLCLPHSEFFPGSFTVLSCPRVSVMATPTQSPNLRVSFETSFPEGPLHPKINYHVLAENYAHWGQLGIITLAKLQKIFVKAKDSFQICINWKYHSGGLERVKKCFAHRWSFFLGWGGKWRKMFIVSKVWWRTINIIHWFKHGSGARHTYFTLTYPESIATETPLNNWYYVHPRDLVTFLRKMGMGWYWKAWS